jgi:threonyl-tRNA synthetase
MKINWIIKLTADCYIRKERDILDQIELILGEETKKQFPKGIKATELLKELDKKITKGVIAIKLNDKLLDLGSSLEENGNVTLITAEDPHGLEIYRHSTAHIMAQAVKDLYPDVKITIGPTIENGFYYDFDKKVPFVPEDLEKIEKRMKEIIKENLPIKRKVLTGEEAIKFYSSLGETYKVEVIEDLGEKYVSLYEQGNFTDLCRGPHLPSTGRIKAFKLLKIAGAYWRGDEKNQMLQRIYGTAFPSKEELNEYLKKLEEAAKRDHRKLGPALGLYNIFDEAGPGVIFYPPKGAILRTILEDFMKKEHYKRGYDMVMTPHLLRGELWETSGHKGFYRENMYFVPVDDQEYVLKPMNCPGHVLIYRSKIRSFRDLPVKFFELGTVYRYEKSGALHGLLRVRGFTQDDAHIFCREDQLDEEILKAFRFAIDINRTFGFHDFYVKLSTKPEKYIGSDDIWEKATNSIRKALETEKVDYAIDEGEGVFYGPKIDIKLRDSLGREWQSSTIQVDFNLPERFDLKYAGSDGKLPRPIMIHRALLGSFERFTGCLIEHYGGAFPLWLSPEQVRILPITDKHIPYADKISEKLQARGIRLEVDKRNEKTGYKIREAQINKIPYMIILGDREMENETLSIRSRDKGDEGEMAVEQFIERLFDEIEKKI